MKYKKLVILFFVLTLLISFPGCDSVRKKKIKIGFITSLNETDAFTKANIDGIQDAIDNSGINSNNLTTIKNVSINTCFDTLAELAENGCEIVFGIGKDFEDFFENAQRQQQQQYQYHQQQQQQQQSWSYEDLFGNRSGMTRQEAYRVLGLQ